MIHVLYVDDEPDLLELGKLFLEQSCDITVITATSARRALEMLKDNPVDAVVSDFQMPDMDGISLLKQIRPYYSALPFILFTGKGREEVVIEALNNGADFYLQKGGDPKSQFTELEHKIRQAVKRRESDRKILFFNRRFTIMTGINAAIVTIHDRNGFLHEVCRVAIETGKFRTALIGMLDASGKFLIPASCRGDANEPASSVPVTTDKSPCREHPASRAVTEKTRIIYQNIRDPDDHPGAINNDHYESHTIAAFPIWHKNEVIGVFQVSESEPQGFGEDEIQLLEEICQTISYALDMIDAEGKRKKTEQALLESEGMFRTLVEESLIGVYIIRGDRFLHVNPKFAQILGYSPGEIINTLNVWDIASPENRDRVRENLHLRLSDVQKCIRYAFEARRKDGSSVEVEVAGTRAVYQGQPIIVGTIIDISDKKRMVPVGDYPEKTGTSQTAGQGHILRHRKNVILGSLTCHDIANRLTVLRGRLKIMRKLVTDRVILDEIQKMGDASRDIYTYLETARVYQEIGNQAPLWQNVEDIIRQEYARLGTNPLALVTEVPALEMYADPLVTRVFSNLFDNTISHGKRASKVKVSAHRQGMGILLVWEDNGTGVPEDDKERIFSPDATDDRGLGLSLCREILAITGIAIRETGIPGNGARFEISIPEGTYLFGPDHQ
jgi:PAS domain S-box-containing protein